MSLSLKTPVPSLLWQINNLEWCVIWDVQFIYPYIYHYINSSQGILLTRRLCFAVIYQMVSLAFIKHCKAVDKEGS